MEDCDIDLFADDATFYANGKTKSEAEPKLQNDGIIQKLGQNRQHADTLKYIIALIPVLHAINCHVLTEIKAVY